VVPSTSILRDNHFSLLGDNNYVISLYVQFVVYMCENMLTEKINYRDSANRSTRGLSSASTSVHHQLYFGLRR
jgi:hypothetical protein